MVNEMDPRDDSPGPDAAQPGLPAGGDGEESSLEDRLADAEGRLSERASELEAARVRIAEMEETAAARDSDVAALRQSVADLEEALSGTNDRLSAAVAGYRDLAVRSNPDVMEDLITGESVGEIDESLERARDLIERVKQGLQNEASLTRVPAGAPERRGPDLSGLSPREKIEYAIGGNR
jgi:chromosome segregation ATPase